MRHCFVRSMFPYNYLIPNDCSNCLVIRYLGRLSLKVPIFNFPWQCWKCKKKMIVTYPITEDVLNSIYKGNLALTYSNPQKKTVVGNVCPNCGVYPEDAYSPSQKYFVGFIDVAIKCKQCGKDVQDYSTNDIFRLFNYEHLDVLDWFCNSCREAEQLESEKALKIQEEERILRIKMGPLLECRLCKANNKDNPETQFIEHHLCYLPEIIMTVCISCHSKIHQTNQYPDLKPKDKRLSKEEKQMLKEYKMKQELITGIAPDEYCIVCRKRYRKNDITIMHEGWKIHQKCIPKREPPKKGKIYFL
jgi:hypothetical protein